MTQPIGSGLRQVFWLVAALTGLTGLVLFLAPQPAGDSYWPWKLTPLVARYLGGLFVGVAVGAILCAAGRDRPTGRRYGCFFRRGLPLRD